MLVVIAVGIAVLALPAGATAKKHKKAKGLGPVVTVTATGNSVSGSGSVSTAVATCPSGTVVFGGGFSAPLLSGSTAIAVFESYRSAPGSWTASALRLGGSGAAASVAYCRRSSRPIADVTATGAVPSGTAKTGSATATCPSGTRLVAGGFQSSRGPGTAALAVPWTNMASGSSWSLVSANNSSGAQTITAHAYCLAGIRAPTVVSSQRLSSVAQYQTLTATTPVCPAPKKKGKKKKKPRQRLSAGGFSTPIPAASPLAVFDSSMEASSAWAATASNASGPTGSISITSQGICV
jgi:hypothetical protein